jgi:hypothetical protein
MKELSVPFSLFDFFAILFPGVIVVFGIYLFINPSLTEAGHIAALSNLYFPRIGGDLTLATFFILSCYLIGQVLNALSELLIDRPANRIFGAHIGRDINHFIVQEALKKQFGNDIKNQSVRRTFIMIESLVGLKMHDAAATAKRFIALAIMFESLALALMIAGIALIRSFAKGHLFSGSPLTLVFVIAFVFILVSLSLWSYRRYKSMWSQTMSMSFVAIVNTGTETVPEKIDTE